MTEDEKKKMKDTFFDKTKKDDDENFDNQWTQFERMG